VNIALTYDDVNIIPKYSELEHRSDCDLSTQFTKNIRLKIPVVSSPMDTITELDMAIELDMLGGMGIIHRFMSIEKQSKMSNTLYTYNVKFGAAIGVTGDWFERAQELVKNGCDVLFIDVAHGHHKLVKNALRRLKNEISNTFEVVAGSVATSKAARQLCEWGADGVRVGIGNGSLCETRIRTGVGIPSITSILDCVSVCDNFGVPVIADGGIRNVGDACKSLGAGADCFMLGSLLSGTKETPGEIEKVGKWPNEQLYKKYRGSSSIDSKKERGEEKNVEGNTKIVPYKGKIKRIIQDIQEGIRSSFSYVGANNISEFHSKVEFVEVTKAGQIEALPHLLG
jgi:IMP dehydrogenase